MPELRKNPLVDRWVIIATERARRPGNIVDHTDTQNDDNQEDCVYCKSEAASIYAYKDIRIVPFMDSEMEENEVFNRESKGVYDFIDGIGYHEIVVETQEHVANMADLNIKQIRDVFKTYVQRLEDLRKCDDFRHAVIYKNHGVTAGSREISHTRSHIFATPVYPLRVVEKLDAAKAHYDKTQHCIYCDLIAQESKDQKRVIMETDHFIVLTPFAGQFLFEMIIIPKKHHCDFSLGIQGNEKELAELMKELLAKIRIGLEQASYNYVIQTAPFRPQDDNDLRWETLPQDYHWHIEIMPRLTRMAGFEKGTGFYICSIPPEATAEYFKGVKTDG